MRNPEASTIMKKKTTWILFSCLKRILGLWLDVGMGEVMELAGFADLFYPRVEHFGLRLLQSSDFQVGGRIRTDCFSGGFASADCLAFALDTVDSRNATFEANVNRD